jgi:hypothetical protein
MPAREDVTTWADIHPGDVSHFDASGLKRRVGSQMLEAGLSWDYLRISRASWNPMAMPGQECLRAHRERNPTLARKYPAERRQQEPIVYLEARPPDLAAKNRQLVAEHENLKLLGSIPAPEEHDELEQAGDDDVQTSDTSKGDLQQSGTPTLPPPQ